MAVIKLDKDKANSLIKDLTRLSSDIESNLGGIGSTFLGKEISLFDSRLKVYSFREKVIEMVQPDDSVVQEIVKEKYLQKDLVPLARSFNNAIKSIISRSELSTSNTTRSIREVTRSLSKIVALVEEFENDPNLRMSRETESVGEYNFNFLGSGIANVASVAGLVTGIGALVVEEVFTSDELGPLGERPSAIDLDKLFIFDDVFDLAADNRISLEEKLAKLKRIMRDNCSDLDEDDIPKRTTNAFIEIGKIIVEAGVNVAKDKISPNKKAKYLIDQGINVLKNDVTNDKSVALTGVVSGVAAGIKAAKEQISNKPSNKVVGSLLSGTKNDGEIITNDVKEAKNKLQEDIKVLQKDTKEQKQTNKVEISKEKLDNYSDKLKKTKEVVEKSLESKKIEKEEPKQVQDVSVDNVIKEEVKLTAKEIALEEEVKSSSITATYDTNSITESSNLEKVKIPIEEISDVKGASVVAGAAGAGVLGKIATSVPDTASAPVMSGMSAGELLGINTTGNNSMSTPVVTTTTSSGSSGIVANSGTVKSSTGGESTSDKGSLGSSPSNDKTTSNKSSSGKGGSTLEDKKSEDEKNSYGEQNKAEDVEQNTKKGMLGDASIAELNAKEDKQIKVATGVSAGGVLGSAVLALAGIMPSFLFVLLLIVIAVVYTTYRVKKKYDRKKRMEVLAAQTVVTTQEVVPMALEDVQNVSDVVEETSVDKTEVVNEEIKVAEYTGGSSNDEFSEQPYEPSRDGVTEIGVSSGKTE